MAIARPIMDKVKFLEWAASRPLIIQKLIKQLPPDRLYLLKESNHRVTIHSYCEDGTVTVLVTGEFNLVVFNRRVFGIKPDDLEECNLPATGELLGTLI